MLRGQEANRSSKSLPSTAGRATLPLAQIFIGAKALDVVRPVSGTFPKGATSRKLCVLCRQAHFAGFESMPTYRYRCEKCGKRFERTETISEHEALKLKCPKCGSKKVSFVPGNVYVVTSKKS